MTVSDWLAIAWVVAVCAALPIAAAVHHGWLWRRPESVPRGYQSMRERNGLPDWPPPPKVSPPPSYRDPAPRTVEDRTAQLIDHAAGLEAQIAVLRREVDALRAAVYGHEPSRDIDAATLEVEIVRKQLEYKRRFSKGAKR